MTRRRRPPDYATQVFINCPFDSSFEPILDALIFAVFDCGFTARCALEIDDGSERRIDNIFRIIDECKYAIHDLSRTELDPVHSLPRFNMPLELGIFLGAKHYGSGHNREKNCLILDMERFRYQRFISDIAGQDIKAHENDFRQAVARVRDWLNHASGRTTIPGPTAIIGRYERYRTQLPAICERAQLSASEMTFKDKAALASTWLQEYQAQEQ
jgi:hypothetical protein